MAITSTEQTSILNLVVSMFNAAPGAANLTSIAASYEANGRSLTTLANNLAMSSAFTDQFAGLVTNEAIANKMAANFGLTSGTAYTNAYNYFVQELAAGKSKATIMKAANDYLTGTHDAMFNDAAAMLTNKTTVAYDYSVTKQLSGATIADLRSSIATVTADAATVTAATTALATGTGTTFSLTDAIDSFTGSSSNDTFIGDLATISAGDQIVGGTGVDTAKLYGIATVLPTMTGVEKLYLNGVTGSVDTSAIADLTTLELVDPSTVQTYTVANGVAVSIATVANGETVDIAGNAVTSLNLTLNNFAGTATGADATLDLNSTAQTTLNITTATANSQVTLVNTGAALTTINVAGDKNLELGHALTTVTTINASTMTGAVDVDTVGASNLTFTGGAGNDRINLVATLTSADTIVGGAGTDTVAFSGAADATLTSTTGAKISGFEIVEIGETADNKTYNLSNLSANNTLTGLVMTVTGAGATTTVTNINAATTGNITFTGDAPEAVLSAADFVSGGTSDTATINLNNDTSDNADGVDLALTFANADVLNFVTTKSSTQGLQTNSVSLTATDAEKIVVTGNDSMSVATVAGTVPTEIDGSGMTGLATLAVDTDASAIASLLVKGTANADAIDVDNAATVSTTIYTGGGDDALLLDGAATTVNTLKFTSTAFNAGDIKAGDVLTIALATATDGSIVKFDMSSTIEGLLKNGGTVLGTSSANVTLTGTSLGATTNIAATNTNANPDTIVIQIDLDGSGTYVEANDWQATVSLTGNANTGSSTLVYDATADLLLLTVA